MNSDPVGLTKALLLHRLPRCLTTEGMKYTALGHWLWNVMKWVQAKILTNSWTMRSQRSWSQKNASIQRCGCFTRLPRPTPTRRFLSPSIRTQIWQRIKLKVIWSHHAINNQTQSIMNSLDLFPLKTLFQTDSDTNYYFDSTFRYYDSHFASPFSSYRIHIHAPKLIDCHRCHYHCKTSSLQSQIVSLCRRHGNDWVKRLSENWWEKIERLSENCESRNSSTRWVISWSGINQCAI